jgi:hypothetical protein
MHPRTGGRVILELDDAAGDPVRYRAVLYTPDVVFHGVATVTREGVVDLGGWDADPPAWLVDLARKFLRTEWRARQVPDPEPWPARISRWRAEK